MNQLIGLVGRVFTNGLGDLDSIPGRVLPKTLKMVFDTSLLSTQQYNVCIKGKMEQSRERSGTLPYNAVLKLLKREPSGHSRLRSPTLLTTLALCKDAIGVFCSPSQLGHNHPDLMNVEGIALAHSCVSSKVLIRKHHILTVSYVLKISTSSSDSAVHNIFLFKLKDFKLKSEKFQDSISIIFFTVNEHELIL